MRKYTILKIQVENIQKIMIYKSHYKSDNCFYVFLYDNTHEDSPAIFDYCFETLEDAHLYSTAEYGVKENEWIMIDDPLPHCQHDIITPVRVKGRNTGAIQWGIFEKLEDGKWMDCSRNPTQKRRCP